MSKFEEKLFDSGITFVAGVDEAGRGACAGPLVVSAVVMSVEHLEKFAHLRDSKALTAKAREYFFPIIVEHAIEYAIIEIDSQEIDAHGLHYSNLEGMRRAVSALKCKPEFVMSDGYSVPGIMLPHLAVWKGDQVAISIAAASILAKVHRDRLMSNYSDQYPAYGFAQHKGYFTAAHKRAIEAHGLLDFHRRSFSNIQKFLHT